VDVQITDIEKFALTITPGTDAAGNVVEGGDWTWSNDNEAVATLAATDALNYEVISTGTLGVANITATNADGTVLSAAVTVVASVAVNPAVLAAGTPEPR